MDGTIGESYSDMYRKDIAEKYIEFIRGCRSAVNELEELFLNYTRIDSDIFFNMEKRFVNVGRVLNDRFVEAYKDYDFQEMTKIRAEAADQLFEIISSVY